ncbi:MAG: pyruvate kinase, partial [Clostridia bacterium]|nr:pyruvate kinase [Clostridia bacterium]
MQKRTKIIATLGPATDDEQVMRDIIKEGVNAARMNFSHGSHEEHKARLERFRAVCKEIGEAIPVLLDTKGPEIRVGEVDGVAELKTGKSFTIFHKDTVGNNKGCSVSYKDLYKDVKKGDFILFDDGLVKIEVKKIDGKDIVCKILNDGVISTKKSVNVPDVSVNLPPLTQKDISDLKFACENDYDFIALSFVRKATDVLSARRILSENGGEDIKLIAKIENREGIENIDGIIAAADGIMVARGDMGVEIPYEEVPFVQNDIIKKCSVKGKIVITATQMLDSMIRNPRPTRAEVSDIATAIVEGTTAIMLSGETAMGKYPADSVHTMANVARQTEST